MKVTSPRAAGQSRRHVSPDGPRSRWGRGLTPYRATGKVARTGQVAFPAVKLGIGPRPVPAQLAVAAAGHRAGSDGDERRRVGLRSYLIYLAVAFLLAMALSWSYAATATLGYRIDELKNEIASLESERERLTYELAACRSMANIERQATTRLGMVRPEYVRAGSVAAAVDPVGSGTAGDRESSVARVIRLTSAGSARGQQELALAAVGTSGGRGALGSLWDRFFRWLTGTSQADNLGWQ